ncbi:MAG TPA: TonB family protein [archaeon]|nr:TonB family protein [archaeon]
MKIAFIISFSLHLLILGSLWHFGWKRVSNIYAFQVHQVQLVTLPRLEAAPPAESVPEVEMETIPPPPEEKKELKPKQKETTPKTAPQKTEEIVGSAKMDESVSGVRSDEFFEFPYFIRLMTDKISRNWRNPYSGEAETVLCTIYFKILKNGDIIGERVEKPSGFSSFDRAALRAVKISSPLPPLPPDYGESQLTVHLDFEYNRK